MLGIAECGVFTALTIAPRFGVLAILPGSIPRHRRYFAAMGVTDRLAGEIAIDVGVVDLADERRTFARLTECGTALRDAHGAYVVVMGCAGMARYRAALEDALGLPVVDPTQAAVGMALSLVRLGLKPRAQT